MTNAIPTYTTTWDVILFRGFLTLPWHDATS